MAKRLRRYYDVFLEAFQRGRLARFENDLVQHGIGLVRARVRGPRVQPGGSFLRDRYAARTGVCRVGGSPVEPGVVWAAPRGSRSLYFSATKGSARAEAKGQLP